MGDNVLAREEKSPRSPIKVPKFVLSGKGCGVVKTARRLAQKQPSFKECVSTGAKHNTEIADLY